jgi:hypothetical protein
LDGIHDGIRKLVIGLAVRPDKTCQGRAKEDAGAEPPGLFGVGIRVQIVGTGLVPFGRDLLGKAFRGESTGCGICKMKMIRTAVVPCGLGGMNGLRRGGNGGQSGEVELGSAERVWSEEIVDRKTGQPELVCIQRTPIDIGESIDGEFPNPRGTLMCGLGKGVGVIAFVKGAANPELMGIGEASDRHGLPTGSGQSREEKSSKYGYDGYDHQQFDEGEPSNKSTVHDGRQMG